MAGLRAPIQLTELPHALTGAMMGTLTHCQNPNRVSCGPRLEQRFTTLVDWSSLDHGGGGESDGDDGETHVDFVEVLSEWARELVVNKHGQEANKDNI